MIFVRGNHEDHLWLDELEQQSEEPIIPIDAYKRVYHLKTGQPWIFQKGNEQVTILGIGRIAAPTGEENLRQGKYLQEYEVERLYQLPQQPLNILLTHDARPDFVLLERGVKSKGSTGMEEIKDILDSYRPPYHFFGHYGGPPRCAPIAMAERFQ
ncbi:metallophosphoesterase [Ktedonospora formicarum]|uniref:Calcineurin-like phosphoesterase domain-containing protein n=1 Tax=Ktedonospora formicarum TaxID=2778364 RepID=A0A8J3MPX0_9CHLR|nr:metallophosphoesterase [Ktedonospora formicarum]GHO42028.1 hypothetical protein KSX_01910 [Ktedonospora formicarum]